MSAHAQITELGRVVALNECAKAILGDSQQVGLRALDAMVRSLRAGSTLRGFAEVSAQMRSWSRELQTAVEQVARLSARQVQLVSALTKLARQTEMLRTTARNAPKFAPLAEVVARLEVEVDAARIEVTRCKRKMTNAIEDLQQLGLMASVLSRAALIEAANGTADQRRSLTEVSREFATRAEKVIETIQVMLSADREALK